MSSKKIIQFGEGGFLRGFADWMLDIVNEKAGFDFMVTVVQPIETGLCSLLSAQNCKYTHICRGVEGVEARQISVIKKCIDPYRDFDEYLSLADDPDYRFIISNTTEAGIVFDENDKLENKPCKSFPGKVTQLLFRRFIKGLDGFIFLPCELIDRNGDKLKECIVKSAEIWSLGTDFINWIKSENIFCNTLVDRINTGFPKDENIDLGYEDKLLNTSEYFHLWVIEGYNGLFDELPFDKCGLNVILTDNLERYRTRKVRILNGAHTSLVPYAMLSGFDTVKSCMDDGTMLSHIKHCIYNEIIPTLDLPKDELIDYADNVLRRFSNPYIKHYLSSISLNSVSKFKVRVLPSITEYIRRFGKTPDTLVFSFAKLIEFYKTGTPTDLPEVITFMKEASVTDILKNTSFWVEDMSFLYDEVIKHLPENIR